MANRNRGKLIGGFYPPEVSRAMHLLATLEDKTLAELLAEAMDMLLVSRGAAPQAVKAHAVMVAPGNARRGKHARIASGTGEF